MIIVGTSAPLKKRKVEKGRRVHYPATKKKELVVSMKQDMDTQKHTKSPTELNRYPPTSMEIGGGVTRGKGDSSKEAVFA